jgi:hypothetical protein
VKPNTIVAVAVLMAAASVNAWAQEIEEPSFGAAVIKAYLPEPGSYPSAGYPYVDTPYGNSRGWVLSGGAGLTSRLAFDGELSVAPAVSVQSARSYSSGHTDWTTAHRDTIVVGLVRLRVSSFFELVGGGGLVFPRTSLTTSGWYRGQMGEKVVYGPTVDQSPSNTARPALTVGANVVGRFNRHFAICAIARLHYLSRGAPLHESPFGNADDARPFNQPSATVLRIGMGIRVTL